MRFTCYSLLFTAMISFGFSSCNKNAPASGNKAMEMEEAILKKSIEQGDPNTMLYALNKILIMDSTKTQYYDTLAAAYIALGNYKGTVAICNKILKLRPEDKRFLEYSAIANQFAGNVDKSYLQYEQLYKLTNNINYRFQIATLHMRAEDYATCDSMVNNMYNVPGAENMKVEILYNDQLERETVSLRPALHYLRGYNYLAQMKNKAAFEEFKKAAMMDEQFIAPRQVMQQMLQQAGAR